MRNITDCSNLLFMATPTNASTANTNSTSEHTALQTAANTQFINDIVTAINNAEAQGLFVAYLTITDPNVDYNYVAHYMQNLGYGVTFPDFPQPQMQPADLFGQAWIDFWTGNFIPAFASPKQPIRMGFAWKNPTA